MRRLPARQIHLDFHTSDKILDIGRDFNKEEFKKALIEGHVNSVTVFGKCHHGYCYYPTKVGTAHPHMAPGRDLAGEMMEACHEIGVYAPLYITLGWSALDAIEHPEWVAKDKNGNPAGKNYDITAEASSVKPEVSWLHMCSAGGYRDYLYRITREVCARYGHLDGLFFDIVFEYHVCYCKTCLEGMLLLGMDAENEKDVREYYEIEKHKTLQGIGAIVKELHPEATLFFNSGGAEIHKPQWHYASTHFELEDLPTTWGGYDKMPVRAKYFSGIGKDYLGMTGKFHRCWGEFGGYKTPEALRYECGALMTWGARISIGDQLHPLGRMDRETYKNIGEAYRYVEQIEDYCFDVSETSKIGVFISDEQEINESLAKLLLDSHIDFDIVHEADSLEKFELLIVPDRMVFNKKQAKQVEVYIESGRKIVLLGGSGLNKEKNSFAFKMPFEYIGKSDCDIDYAEVTEDISKNMVKAPVLFYDSAHKIRGKGKRLSNIRNPYFNRTYGAYCSHANTPYSEEIQEYPGAILKNNVLYIAHEIAVMYKRYGSTYHRRYFENIINTIYPQRNIRTVLPCGARIRFVEQKKENRYVVHLLYALPGQRGEVAVIEDMPPLSDTEVTVRVERIIKKIVMQPQGQELPYIQQGGEVSFVVDQFAGHQMIVLEA